MSFEELKELCRAKLKEFPQYAERCVIELKRAKICYEDNNFDVAKEIIDLGDNCSDAYVLPFFLGVTKSVDLTKPIEYENFSSGSGGLDIDTDISTEGKPKLFEHLQEKYGKDHVTYIGTYTEEGMSPAIKDILRKRDIPFKVSNDFCSFIDNDISFDENMEAYKKDHPDLYRFYLEHKADLDYVPKLQNMIRSTGKHAGGCAVFAKPVYEYVPVIRPQGEMATAFVENGQESALDNLGDVKYDLLGISTLDLLKDTVDSISEKMYWVEENGKKKIVPQSWIDVHSKEIQK